MPTYVKTDYVPEDCEYITEGKEYALFKIDEEGAYFLDDDSDTIYTCIPNSLHLDGRPWTVINRP